MGTSINISSYEIEKDPQIIRGMPSVLEDIPEVIPSENADHEGPYSEIVVPDFFPPGSVMLFETHVSGVTADMDSFCSDGVETAFSGLDLVDLNTVIYRAEGEELDATAGEVGAYDVPGIGKLVYCGLEGWMHPLRHIMKYNDLGHALCGHLRDGSWAMDYIWQRLSKFVFFHSICIDI